MLFGNVNCDSWSCGSHFMTMKTQAECESSVLWEQQSRKTMADVQSLKTSFCPGTTLHWSFLLCEIIFSLVFRTFWFDQSLLREQKKEFSYLEYFSSSLLKIHIYTNMYIEFLTGSNNYILSKGWYENQWDKDAKQHYRSISNFLYYLHSPTTRLLSSALFPATLIASDLPVVSALVSGRRRSSASLQNWDSRGGESCVLSVTLSSEE